MDGWIILEIIVGFFYCVLLCFIVILIEHYVFKSSMFVLPFYNKRMYVCLFRKSSTVNT